MSAQVIVREYRSCGRMSQYQAGVLAAYLELGSTNKVAAKLHLDTKTVSNVLYVLRKKGILTRDSRRSPYRLLKPGEEPANNEIPEVDCPAGMTNEELDWMLNEYPKYQKNRSEAARILGRSRAEICQMAIALKIDLRSGGF